MVTILRRSLIACCFCLTFSATFAQNGYEDVVYLKNGSVIHGMIIEQVPNVSIKIQTVDRNIFVYKMEEVEKMTKEPVTAATRPGGQKSLFKNKF